MFDRNLQSGFWDKKWVWGLRELTEFLRVSRKAAAGVMESEVEASEEVWEELDRNPESETLYRIRLALWRFTKSLQGLPSISKTGAEWIENLKANLNQLFTTIEITNPPKTGQKIKRTGLNTVQLASPLFKSQTSFPSIRQETIHQVKGESIDGVLVLGSAKFFNSVVEAIIKNKNTEDRRIAYVAMTRARHVLLIGLPASHYDKYLSFWRQWGFSVLE
ncbi:MAG: hypothetical protein GX493_00460 [Firmicutes bacterium]|nr:hypothetical protein [Bacillota bacterium]